MAEEAEGEAEEEEGEQPPTQMATTLQEAIRLKEEEQADPEDEDEGGEGTLHRPDQPPAAFPLAADAADRPLPRREACQAAEAAAVPGEIEAAVIRPHNPPSPNPP